MSTKGWRPSWTQPGASEQTHPFLDLNVNRNLLVRKNVHIHGDLTIDGNFAPWQSYTPTMFGYRNSAGTGTLATGIIYTAIGRYRKLGTTICFEFVVQVSGPRSANWVSNAYVDLPVKTNFMFSTSAVYHATGSADDSQWNALFGIARANATAIAIVPGLTSPSAIGLMFNIIPPYEFVASGVYEAAP